MKNLFLFFFIILFLSCEVGEDFVPDNPIDPINPDYEKPEVEFITVPSDLEILQDPAFEFAWNGNAENMIYRFSFDGEWSEWEERKTSATINHMDEGSHTFAVQSKYTNDDTSNVISSTFIVDAVKGSSLMIYPRKFSAESGQEFEIYLMAEEVSDLAAAEVQLSFDVSMIEIVDVEVGDIFEGVGEAIFIDDISRSGIIGISAGVWGNDFPQVSGSKSIAKIMLKAKNKGLSNITIDSKSILRNPLNEQIEIIERVGGIVEIK